MSVCPKCQGNYSKDKFIEGILYEAGGPWNEKYKWWKIIKFCRKWNFKA